MTETEVLSREEIQSRYPSQWVLVDNPETDDQMEVVRGIVLFHGKDRDQVYQRAAKLKPKYFAVMFTGVMSDDAVVVL